MCPSRARVFGVPASPYRLRLRPCLGSGVVERVVCGAGLSHRLQAYLRRPPPRALFVRPLVLSAGSCAPGVSRLLPPPRRTHPPSRATRQQMMHVRSRCMCPSRARVFGVPASPYRLRLRPCLGSRVVERVVCGAGLSRGCLTGLVRSAVGGPSQPRPAHQSRRGFAHRFDLSTLPRFTRLRRAPRIRRSAQVPCRPAFLHQAPPTRPTRRRKRAQVSSTPGAPICDQQCASCKQTTVRRSNPKQNTPLGLCVLVKCQPTV